MAYRNVVNKSGSLPASDRFQLIREFDSLRAELDDVRAKYTALVALLVAATALGAGYSTGTALATRQFTP